MRTHAFDSPCAQVDMTRWPMASESHRLNLPIEHTSCCPNQRAACPWRVGLCAGLVSATWRRAIARQRALTTSSSGCSSSFSPPYDGGAKVQGRSAAVRRSPARGGRAEPARCGGSDAAAGLRSPAASRRTSQSMSARGSPAPLAARGLQPGPDMKETSMRGGMGPRCEAQALRSWCIRDAPKGAIMQGRGRGRGAAAQDGLHVQALCTGAVRHLPARHGAAAAQRERPNTPQRPFVPVLCWSVFRFFSSCLGACAHLRESGLARDVAHLALLEGDHRLRERRRLVRPVRAQLRALHKRARGCASGGAPRRAANARARRARGQRRDRRDSR